MELRNKNGEVLASGAAERKVVGAKPKKGETGAAKAATAAAQKAKRGRSCGGRRRAGAKEPRRADKLI
jgi:hypothetical protein